MNKQKSKHTRSIHQRRRDGIRLLFALAFCVAWGVSSGVELPPLKNAQSINFEYPPSSRRANEEGIVIVSFLIDGNGRTQDQLMETQANARMANAVLAELKRTVFDVPTDWESTSNVRYRYQLTVHFTLGECSSPDRFDNQAATAYVCGIRRGPPKPGPECSSLDAIHATQKARQLWNDSRPKNYSYGVRRGSMWRFSDWPESNEVQVVIRNRKVQRPSAYFVERYQQYLIIDRIFDRIADIAASNPDCLKVKFDPMFGFPISVYSDHDLNVSDGSEEIEVVDFQLK